MAKPRPVSFDVPGKQFPLKFYQLPDVVPITSFFPSGFPMSKWEDLELLKEKFVQVSADKKFTDLEAITKALSDNGNPSSIEAIALPLALSGLNLDLSTMNSRGVANVVAVSALVTVQADLAQTQVLIVAQSSDFAELLKSSIATLNTSLSQPVKVGGVSDASAHVVIGTAQDATKAVAAELRLVVLTEIDQICAASQDAETKQLLASVKTGEKQLQILVFNPELLMSDTDAFSLKIRSIQDAAMGKTGFVQGKDGKELVDFIKGTGVGVNTYQLASIGAYDMPSLRNTDPQVMTSTFGATLAEKITMELERWERSRNDGSVPPFDMASGQWEWTPDTLENWVAKGLDQKFFHEEPDGSRWILCSASHALMARGQGGGAPAPWDVDPHLTPGGVDDYDEDADLAWAEMYGACAPTPMLTFGAIRNGKVAVAVHIAAVPPLRAEGAGDGGGAGFDMGGMAAGLDLSSLAPELQGLLGRIEQSAGPQAVADLAGAFQRANVQSLDQLRGMRWTMTQSLGIDYGLAAEISQALDS